MSNNSLFWLITLVLLSGPIVGVLVYTENVSMRPRIAHYTCRRILKLLPRGIVFLLLFSTFLLLIAALVPLSPWVTKIYGIIWAGLITAALCVPWIAIAFDRLGVEGGFSSCLLAPFKNSHLLEEV